MSPKCNAADKPCDRPPLGCITKQKGKAGPYGGVITMTIYVWFCSEHMVNVFPDMIEIPKCLKPFDAVEFIGGTDGFDNLS